MKQSMAVRIGWFVFLIPGKDRIVTRFRVLFDRLKSPDGKIFKVVQS